MFGDGLLAVNALPDCASNATTNISKVPTSNLSTELAGRGKASGDKNKIEIELEVLTKLLKERSKSLVVTEVVNFAFQRRYQSIAVLK